MLFSDEVNNILNCQKNLAQNGETIIALESLTIKTISTSKIC